MRTTVLLLLVLVLMGCKKAHGPGDRTARDPVNVEAEDQQVEAAEAAAEAQAAEDSSYPRLATGWAFGELYRVADHKTGVVCYVANYTPPAVSCVVPTNFPTEDPQ